MKALVLSLLIVTGFTVPAQADENKLVCRELSGDPTTVVITLDPGQESKLSRGGSLKEGVKYDYTLEIYKKSQAYRDVEAKGQVETEDVMFNFESNDKKITLSVYMDELDQTTLTVDGNSTDMACF